MRYNKAVISSPATLANFGPGFDSFGLCLDSPRDTVTIQLRQPGRREVKVSGRSGIPTDPEKNTASYAAMRLADMCGCEEYGFSMTVKKGMKPGSGIGSSAASSVGGALAMATLMGVRDESLILEAAAMGEELIAGSRHFDNVAAALHGGFTVVSDAHKRTILRIKPPSFQIVVVLPEISVETRKAREVLPKSVPMSDAVSNLSMAAGMVHSMMKRDARAVGGYLDDTLSVPYRKKLVPGFDEVRKSALDSGALGVSLGGSGPAVFAIALENASKIKQAMVRTFRESSGLESESFVTVPGEGARVEMVH
ncbi:MAG: homoserine kinase [Thermoplasmata archaeon]|nr:homoserine kinase [Thermoplasmata archaeon]TFG68054.1 MAG: homoserine kinase [Methanomassiliicoccus sp.]